LVERELAPYDTARVELQGSEIILQPSAAQTLTLALHELATNAAKYGALSSSSGRVLVTWRSIDSFELVWTETDGPRVTAPTRKGFGSRIVAASVEQQLGGRVRFDWKATGLECVISIPTDSNLLAVSVGRTSSYSDYARLDEQLQIRGNRILVVEDEALVAIALCDMLRECGFEVVGPCSTVSEALNVISAAKFDGAVLDVNVNGEMIYPAAELLAERNIPFVFMTGYSLEGIDARFRSVRAMHKPVEREKLVRLFKPALSGEFVRNAS
jgi:CheY-like chemotaxis protein